MGTLYSLEHHRPELLSICQRGRLHRDVFLSWYVQWLFAEEDDSSEREEEGQTNGTNPAARHAANGSSDFETLIGIQAARLEVRMLHGVQPAVEREVFVVRDRKAH